MVEYGLRATALQVSAEWRGGTAAAPADGSRPDDRHRDGNPEHRSADSADEAVAAAARRRHVHRRTDRHRHVHAAAALDRVRRHRRTTQVVAP